MVCCSLCLALAALVAGFIYIITRRRVSPSVDVNKAHVLITGGSYGLGLEVAKIFARQCSKITIIARDKTKLESAKELLSSLGSAEVLTISCDLTGPFADIKAAVDEAFQINGQIDILFNCAGRTIAKEFDRQDPANIEQDVRVNYLSAAFVTRAALPKMISHNRGIVAFTSSQAGQIGLYGNSSYSASKFALRGLAEGLAMELEPHGISVSLVCPPATDTPGYAAEKIGKPLALQKIEKLSGTHSAEAVAKAIVPQVLAGKFFCSFGFNGWLLSTTTAGMAPPAGFLQTIAESLPFLRIISVINNWVFSWIIQNNRNQTY